MNQNIQHMLIANRGEIAHRIIRTARQMGIRTLAVFSEADAQLPFVQAADAAVRLPGNMPSETYLNEDRILDIALTHGVDAIHPGYGFVSESAAFAKKVRSAGLLFIGPNTEAIARMGSKSEAKSLMARHQIPVIPGYSGALQDLDTLEKEGLQMGFPLLVKAVAGGGGKGMRIVRHKNQLRPQLEAARREATAAFNNGDLLLERYFESVRHIEWQIFGDQHGQVVHLHERECTIQRRYQKIMEESPSPALSDKDRQVMSEAALQAARALHYDNAGTVEFIYAGPGEFYFLEVNTRLQVEHPVTEAITGIDLVEWQILVAEGQPLPRSQANITAHGYALQFRLYAEDPGRHFLPAGGQVHLWEQPDLPQVRFDGSIRSGNTISTYYDPMIAKIIVHSPNRYQTFRKMRFALQNVACLGPATNQPLLLGMLDQPEIIQGHYDTQYLLDNSPEKIMPSPHEPDCLLAALGCLALDWHTRCQKTHPLHHLPGGWRNNFYQGQKVTYHWKDQEFAFTYRQNGLSLQVDLAGQLYQLQNIIVTSYQLHFEWDQKRIHLKLVSKGNQYWVQLPNGLSLHLIRAERFPAPKTETSSDQYLAPMPGQIIEVLARPEQIISEGDPLMILSSMKMEHTIFASGPGKIERILVRTGDQVEKGTSLLQLEKKEPAHAV